MVIQEELFKTFPSRKIKAVDGMLVTAETWEEAHEYQRHYQRYATLLGQGAGILTGLEVMASDPPDNSVYLLPGIAVDQTGQIIVVPKATSYQLGRTAEGPLYLCLNYEESEAQPDPHQNVDYNEGPLFIRVSFSLTTRSVRPDRQGVELARIKRSSRNASIHAAKEAAHPGLDELDLRFRSKIGFQSKQVIKMAVCYLGQPEPDRAHLQGVNMLAQHCGPLANLQVCVDMNVPFGPELQGYDLLYLVGLNGFTLTAELVNGVRNFWQGQGTILIESCRPSAGPSPADPPLRDLVSRLNLSLAELPFDHSVLLKPFLFGSPPAGFESQESSRLLAAERLLFSTCDYGRLWQRQRRHGPASREEIRAALEWGANLLTYALERQP
jgi:hypothetical protein